MRRRRLSRLLIPLPSRRLGGTERHTAELASRLAARGLAVTLGAEPALLEGLRHRLGPSVAIREAALGWDEDADPDGLRQERAAAGLIAEVAPELSLVPLPWPEAGSGALRALGGAGIPRVALLHLAPGGAEARGRAGPELEGCVFAAVSAPTARRGAARLGLSTERVAVLPNPAPRVQDADRGPVRAMLRVSLGLPQDGPLALFVGRLEVAKGAELLPEISARLPCPLLVLGDGELRGMLESRAAADPRGALRVLGPVPDAGPWMSAADVLVLPSRLEGAPLVFLEAAAYRLPVVATAAALEALGEAAPRLARLAPAAPDALADAMAESLDDAAGTAARVAMAAAHAARLGWDGVVERMLGLLRAAAVLTGERAA